MSDATQSSPTSDDSEIRAHDCDHPSKGDIWPVYAGKSFNIWQPDTGDYYDSADAMSVVDHLQEKRQRQAKVSTSAFAEQTTGWLHSSSTLPCLHPRIAFRDVTRATDRRTVVAALVPGGRVIQNKAPYLLQTRGNLKDEAYLLGVMCSMIFDWQSRRTVELSMTFEQIGLLTTPDPGSEDPVRMRVVEIAGRLPAADDRYTDWAREVGVPVGSANDEVIKQDLICELDACVACLYGLNEDDLAVIYETFSETVDYSDRHAAVLDHFRRIRDNG